MDTKLCVGTGSPLATLPFSWALEHSLRASAPPSPQIGLRASTHNPTSPLALSRCYAHTHPAGSVATSSPREFIRQRTSDIFRRPYDLPQPYALESLCGNLFGKLPPDVGLTLAGSHFPKMSSCPSLRELVVEGYPVLHRMELIRILLEHSMTVEASMQMSVLVDSPGFVSSVIPQEYLDALWGSITQKEIFSPSLVASWLEHMPEKWNLPAEIAVQLIIRPVVAPVTLAYRVIEKYMSGTASENPTPYHAFFLVAHNSLRTRLLSATDTVAGTQPMRSGSAIRGVLHWNLIWRVFQGMNKRIPNWALQLPEEDASALATSLLSVLLTHAPPILCLFVARKLVKLGCLGDVRSAVLMIRRLPNNSLPQSSAVVQRLCNWLLRRSSFHRNIPFDVFAVATSLIRLQLYDTLADLYNRLFEGIYSLYQGSKRTGRVHVYRYGMPGMREHSE